VARRSYPRHAGPLPPALPPVARTVGQVVAEALKLYGTRFWSCLVLGLPIAIADPLAFDRPLVERSAVLVALSPLFTLAYAEACTIEGESRAPRRAWLVALGVGTLVFVPAAVTLGWFVLLGIAWLGLVGWVVPVAIHEALGLRACVRRALELGRADLVHAIGSIAALVLVFGLTRNALAWLLREQADNTVKVSVFLSDVVVSPVIFLGSAIVYRDLVARVGTTREQRLQARADAVAARAE
jgi:hypothetical protein